MPPTIQNTIEEFEDLYCSIGNSYDVNKSYYEDMLKLSAFLTQALTSQAQMMAEKIKELYGEPNCGRLHHRTKHLHKNMEECPVVKELNQLLTSYKDNGLIK